MPIMGWLSKLRGGGDELGWDDLVRRIVDAIAALRQYGPRGEVAFPESVIVRVTVREANTGVVQGFVDRPELDREVVTGVANRCDVTPDTVPAREYAVSGADRIAVTATEGAPRAWQLAITGGDLAGQTLVLPAGWSELAFGAVRGTARSRRRNDLVVCDKTEFVSSRAGRIFRAGHQSRSPRSTRATSWSSSGPPARGAPARTAPRRATLKPGDGDRARRWPHRDGPPPAGARLIRPSSPSARSIPRRFAEPRRLKRQEAPC